MKGFKGFNLDWTCSPNGNKVKYEVGKTFKEPEADLCKKGFHFCEDPLDVLGYYAPGQSKYAEVEAEEVSDKKDGDSKRVCKSLTISAEIGLSQLLLTGIKFRLAKYDFTNTPDKATGYSGAASATGYSGAASATGDSGAALATGYSGAASATGNSGAASATGDSGAASATGYSGAASATGDSGAASATGNSGAALATGAEGCACAVGLDGKALGAKGCWLTLAEWKEVKGELHRVNVKTARVDGKKVKANTFYTLKGGKFVEVK